jgi:hypothetical protein
MRCSGSHGQPAAEADQAACDRAAAAARLLAPLVRSDGAIGAYMAAIVRPEASAAPVDAYHAM